MGKYNSRYFHRQDRPPTQAKCLVYRPIFKFVVGMRLNENWMKTARAVWLTFKDSVFAICDPPFNLQTTYLTHLQFTEAQQATIKALAFSRIHSDS